MLEALATAVLLGGINTLADFASVELKLRAHPLYLAARVILVCYAVGAVVGMRAKQLIIGTVSGLIIGAIVGGTYSFLAPVLGAAGLVVAWAIFWICFALLQTLLHGDSGAATAVFQGALAAAFSGAAFFGLAAFGSDATSKDANYLRLLATWSGTFLPGLIVLFWRRA